MPIEGENVLMETEFCQLVHKRSFNVAIGYKIREKIVEKYLFNGCKPKSIIFK